MLIGLSPLTQIHFALWTKPGFSALALCRPVGFCQTAPGGRAWGCFINHPPANLITWKISAAHSFMVQLIYDKFLPGEISQAKIKDTQGNHFSSHIHTFEKTGENEQEQLINSDSLHFQHRKELWKKPPPQLGKYDMGKASNFVESMLFIIRNLLTKTKLWLTGRPKLRSQTKSITAT